MAIVPGADGVVAIAGTPTTTGAFALAITATNGSGTVTQHFALTVEQAPTITSAGSDAVKVGTAFSFKVATTGYPEPALTETGALPAGVTFVAGANGTATVSGTPPTVGTSTFAITAASTVGTVTQTFTLTVEQAPAITSASSYAATLGTALDFPVTATGYPAPTLTEVGGLPGGVTFDNAGSGTATIAGSPTATGLFALTVTATSTAGTVSQRFTLTVEQAPTITSASSYATKVGTAFSFKVTTTGYPAPALTETGALPAGVTFATGTGGTATIAGKPTAVTAAKGAAALHHRRQCRRNGHPDLHAHRQPVPVHHQRQLVHRQGRYRLQLPGDHHRYPGTDTHRVRGPARRGHRSSSVPTGPLPSPASPPP